MPHKTAAATACDTLTPTRRALRSVNTVTLQADGTLAGDSTDGDGLRPVAARRRPRARRRRRPWCSVRVARRGRCVVALADAGAQPSRSLPAGPTPRRRPPRSSTRRAWPGPTATTRRAAATLVVNATPIGMGDGALAARRRARCGRVRSSPISCTTRSRRRCSPRPAQRGAHPVDGLGMLVHQAALQVERWSGQVAPVAVMRRGGRADALRVIERERAQLSGPCCRSQCVGRRPVLQGTFDTLSFSEVLRLLAGTRARPARCGWTPESRPRGGSWTACVAPPKAATSSNRSPTSGNCSARMVDIGFVVARHAGGTFRFVADETPPWAVRGSAGSRRGARRDRRPARPMARDRSRDPVARVPARAVRRARHRPARGRRGDAGASSCRSTAGAPCATSRTGRTAACSSCAER